MTTENREKLATSLGKFLADTYMLYLKSQNFHWHVTGPHFHSLHKMFEEQYTELALAVDEIAERIRELGYQAPATFSDFLRLTNLKEDKSDIPAMQMVSILCHDHEALAKHAEKVLTEAQNAHDEVTVDLMISRGEAHDKAAWMLRSTLE